MLAPTHKHDCGHHPWLLEQLLLAIQANARQLIYCASPTSVSYAEAVQKMLARPEDLQRTLAQQQLPAQGDAPTFAKSDVVVPKTMRPPTLKVLPTCILPKLPTGSSASVHARLQGRAHIHRFRYKRQTMQLSSYAVLLQLQADLDVSLRECSDSSANWASQGCRKMLQPYRRHHVCSPMVVPLIACSGSRQSPAVPRVVQYRLHH
jgi:hypothetical protein